MCTTNAASTYLFLAALDDMCHSCTLHLFAVLKRDFFCMCYLISFLQFKPNQVLIQIHLFQPLSSSLRSPFSMSLSVTGSCQSLETPVVSSSTVLHLPVSGQCLSLCVQHSACLISVFFFVSGEMLVLWAQACTSHFHWVGDELIPPVLAPSVPNKPSAWTGVRPWMLFIPWCVFMVSRRSF